MPKPLRGTLRRVNILRASIHGEELFIAEGVNDYGNVTRTSYIVNLAERMIETRNSLYMVDSWAWTQAPYQMSKAKQRRLG